MELLSNIQMVPHIMSTVIAETTGYVYLLCMVEIADYTSMERIPIGHHVPMGVYVKKTKLFLQYMWEHTEITGKVPFAVDQKISF